MTISRQVTTMLSNFKGRTKMKNLKKQTKQTKIKNLSTLINGKGGGQNFFATAGGDNIKGINDTIKILEP